MANLKEIQKFIKEISRTDIFKVDIKLGDLELIIQNRPDNNKEQNISPQYLQAPQVDNNQQVITFPATNLSPDREKENASSSNSLLDNSKTIKSPIVGTFYKKPAPNKPPFVNVGDDIQKGQVICIIEAMKLFNEIESEVEGKIIEILVNDATPVEFDQPLFILE